MSFSQSVQLLPEDTDKLQLLIQDVINKETGEIKGFEVLQAFFESIAYLKPVLNIILKEQYIQYLILLQQSSTVFRQKKLNNVLALIDTEKFLNFLQSQQLVKQDIKEVKEIENLSQVDDKELVQYIDQNLKNLEKELSGVSEKEKNQIVFECNQMKQKQSLIKTGSNIIKNNNLF